MLLNFCDIRNYYYLVITKTYLFLGSYVSYHNL